MRLLSLAASAFLGKKLEPRHHLTQFEVPNITTKRLLKGLKVELGMVD